MSTLNEFVPPLAAFGDLDGSTALRLVVAAADVSLVVDDGIVQQISIGGDGTLAPAFEPFRNRAFVDTVAPDSRTKALDLLAEAGTARARPREINHPSADGSLPIRYAAVKDGKAGRVLVVGRDLRAVSALEQRLTSTQAAMERDYARVRAAEARYRILFHLTSEAVLIVEAQSRRVVEANPAAQGLFVGVTKLVGRTLPQLFDASAAGALQGLAAQALSTGDAAAAGLQTSDNDIRLDIRASLFRQEGAQLLIVRLSPVLAADVGVTRGSPIVLDVIDSLPDGLVCTEPDGSLLEANAAFLDLVQVATVEQARGRRLDAWLARGGADFEALSQLLDADGSVRGYVTTLRGTYGGTEDVEISAVRIKGALPCLGFSMRAKTRPRTLEARLRADMPRSVDELTGLVGRVPMKDLVRETTDIIERLCIEAALQITGDNRASAAELLGLSRQSLYAKLHRFGIADMGDSSESSDG